MGGPPAAAADAQGRGAARVHVQGAEGVVREHFKDLGKIKMEQLQAALTTFPRARRWR
jgi:hypothetical protein